MFQGALPAPTHTSAYLCHITQRALALLPQLEAVAVAGQAPDHKKGSACRAWPEVRGQEEKTVWGLGGFSV